MMWWNDPMGYPAGWAGWLLMTVGMIAFWALVIAAIWALFRAPHVQGRDRTARDTLDERFARGEIDTDEYRTRRAELGTRH